MLIVSIKKVFPKGGGGGKGGGGVFIIFTNGTIFKIKNFKITWKL